MKKESHKFKKDNVSWNKDISTLCADSNEPCADSSGVSHPPSTQIKANRTVRMKDEEYYLVTNKSRDGTSRTMPDCEHGSYRLPRFETSNTFINNRYSIFAALKSR